MRKILGQHYPAAGKLEVIYATPAAKHTVISSATVCNGASSEGIFRIAFLTAGAADDDKQFMYRYEPIRGHRTFIVTVGATLGPGEMVKVYSSNGQMSFQLFGDEEDV